MPVLRFRRNNDELFNINHSEIKRALSDANAPLVLKANQLIEKALSINYDEINNQKLREVKEVIKEVKDVLKELSRTRIKDGKPLTSAVNVVKEFFNQYESNLKSSLKVLSTKAIEIHETLTTHANANNPTCEVANNEENEHSLGNTANGASIVSSALQDEAADQSQNNTIVVEDINHKWTVENFNRNMIDLEQLRNFFTDHALKNALNAHLREHGPNTLNGVTYKKILD